MPFVVHAAKEGLFCLWQLGLCEPDILWDCWVNEKALTLGRNHHRYHLSSDVSEGEQIRIKERLVEEEELRLGLKQTCQRYGIFPSRRGGKLQDCVMPLDSTLNIVLSDLEMTGAAENAEALAKLYPAQVNEVARHGILQHLVTVEMPWTKTVARMEWTGVVVDARKAKQIRQVCAGRLPQLESKLKDWGVHHGYE